MDEAPHIKGLNDIAHSILKTAAIRGEVDGSDGAYSQRKYCAWRQHSVNDGILRELVLCGNHNYHTNDELHEAFNLG